MSLTICAKQGEHIALNKCHLSVQVWDVIFIRYFLINFIFIYMELHEINPKIKKGHGSKMFENHWSIILRKSWEAEETFSSSDSEKDTEVRETRKEYIDKNNDSHNDFWRSYTREMYLNWSNNSYLTFHLWSSALFSFLFNGISTFVRYLTPKKNSWSTI